MPSVPNFADLLLGQRQAAGLTQEELAARTGMSVEAISTLERGVSRFPHKETIITLADALQLDQAARIQWEVAARVRLAPTARALPLGLPAQLTPLIGREAEVAAVGTLLRRAEVRLLTLSGPGGIGKTRLALNVASECGDNFPNGITVVSLASLRDPELVIPAIAHTLGLREAGQWPLLERLQTHLAEQQALLVLDNFEHVLPAAPALTALLAACPSVKILVTSRAILHVHGEYTFPVPPLALPAHEVQIDEATRHPFPAVALFVERVQAIRPHFQLTPTNVRAVEQICARLDGLPLAIELAAARSNVLPPQALLARLERRLPLLTSRLQDIPERQQTMRTTLAWSYDLLTPQEQRLFRRLAVFVGVWNLEAAQAVAASQETSDSILEGLEALIDNSLIFPHPDTEEARFGMWEVVREYALECLMTSGEAQPAQAAHAAYYLALAETIEPRLTSTEQQRWLDYLALDQANLYAALEWLAEQGQTEQVLRLGGALWWFWWMRGQVSAGRTFLEQALARHQETDGSVRAKAFRAAGVLQALQGSLREAEALCQEGLTLFQALEDTSGIVTSLWLLAYVITEQGQYAIARPLIEEALARARQSQDGWGIAYSLELLAAIGFNQGEYVAARSLAEESLALSRAASDPAGITRSLWLCGVLAFVQGRLAEAHRLLSESLEDARALGDTRDAVYSLVVLGYVAILEADLGLAQTRLEESLALLNDLGDRRGSSWALYGLGWVALGHQQAPEAQVWLEQALALLLEVGQPWFLALTLEALACAVALQGHPTWAARLWGHAEAIRKTLGASKPMPAEQMQEQLLGLARAQLGEEAFAVAWAEGRQMSLDTVLSTRDHPLRASASPAQSTLGRALARPRYPAGLTAREVEVLRLVAAGLTDQEVAEKLIIAPRTVNTHLTSIYNKLAINNRVEATRFAVEHHLV
jgi:predicted ATPase/DNA-binding CsgD family transcriptional regulator